MKNQSSIAIGLILILLGACFLILQFVPSLGALVDFDFLWPLIPLGIGLLMVILGFSSSPSRLIPGTILSGDRAHLIRIQYLSAVGFLAVMAAGPRFCRFGDRLI